MEAELMQTIVSAIFAVLVAFVGYASQKFVLWLKQKGVTEEIASKKNLVKIAVDAAEQLYWETDGPTKKSMAKEMAIDLLNKAGLNVDESELDSFIEAIVGEMNQAKDMFLTDIQEAKYTGIDVMEEETED